MPPSSALLTLILTPGLGPTLVKRLTERFDSAEGAMGAPAAQWAEIRGISSDRADTLQRQAHALIASGAAAAEIDRATSLGIQLLSLDDPGYPRLLRSIPDPPPVLWVRGELRETDALAIGIVGSRRCTTYGRLQADRFAAGLASAGLTIVSGGAYGIDHAAHAAAYRLRAGGGRTIAVIGSGLDVPYPREHADFFRQISEGAGAILSEWPLGMPPAADHFPRRNRIISGLSLGIVLIEAADRSGALITARLCVEDHNRELFALPGPVDSPQSAGCHLAIREGWAKLTTSVADVLESLGEAGTTLLQAHLDTLPGDTVLDITIANLSERQRTLLTAARTQPSGGLSLDDLVAATGLPVHQVQSDLTLLELRGLLTRSGGRVMAKSSACG